jgi:hypothetical protein
MASPYLPEIHRVIPTQQAASVPFERPPNGIVEADELARQRSAACDSYRSSVVKVLDGRAA